MDWAIYVLISSVIILVTVMINYAFAKLILNLRTISSFNAHYIYPKDKPLWRKSVMLRLQFLIKMKITFVILFGSDKLSDFKNVCILSATIEYILSTERFNFPFWRNHNYKPQTHIIKTLVWKCSVWTKTSGKNNRTKNTKGEDKVK